MKRILSLVIFVIAMFTGMVSANERFQYQETQYIYVVTEEEAIAYAEFAEFVELRRIIGSKMAHAEPRSGGLTPLVYSVRLLGKGDQQVVFIGDDWISDGVNVAALSEEELGEIDRIISHRQGQGIPLEKLEAAIRHHLANE